MPGTRASGIEVKYALRHLFSGKVAVSGNDHVIFAFEGELVKVVHKADRHLANFQSVGLRERQSPWSVVSTAADGADRSNFMQGVEDFLVSDISRVKDIFRVLKDLPHFRAQESMSIGDDAND